MTNYTALYISRTKTLTWEIQIAGLREGMVPETGIEPATFALRVRCSTG